MNAAKMLELELRILEHELEGLYAAQMVKDLQSQDAAIVTGWPIEDLQRQIAAARNVELRALDTQRIAIREARLVVVKKGIDDLPPSNVVHNHLPAGQRP